MEPETINSTDLRTKTRDLMERVKFHGHIFLIETFGRPMAIIISVEEYMRLKEQSANGTRARLSPTALKTMHASKALKSKTRRALDSK